MEEQVDPSLSGQHAWWQTWWVTGSLAVLVVALGVLSIASFNTNASLRDRVGRIESGLDDVESSVGDLTGVDDLATSVDDLTAHVGDLEGRVDDVESCTSSLDDAMHDFVIFEEIPIYFGC